MHKEATQFWIETNASVTHSKSTVFLITSSVIIQLHKLAELDGILPGLKITNCQASANEGYPIKLVNILFMGANQRLCVGFTGFYLKGYIASMKTR
jgi:hypothetical protein